MAQERFEQAAWPVYLHINVWIDKINLE